MSRLLAADINEEPIVVDTSSALIVSRPTGVPVQRERREVSLPEIAEVRAAMLTIPNLLDVFYHPSDEVGGLSQSFRRRLEVTLRDDAVFSRVMGELISCERCSNEIDLLREMIHRHLLEFVVEHLLRVNTSLQHDELTGLPNQSAFRKFLPGYFREMRAAGRNFSILRLDIDHFKGINTRFTHGGGDYVLKEIANLLRENVKGFSDLVIRGGSSFRGGSKEEPDVARDGGEELAVAFPDTILEEGFFAGERLIELIRDHEFEYNGEKFYVTLTGGVGMMEDFDGDASALIDRVNSALMIGKGAGRDKMVFSSYDDDGIPFNGHYESPEIGVMFALERSVANTNATIVRDDDPPVHDDLDEE
jgi:GGDEF domain-containing protein